MSEPKRYWCREGTMVASPDGLGVGMYVRAEHYEDLERDNAALREHLKWALGLVTDWVPTDRYFMGAYDTAQSALKQGHARSTEPTTCPHGVPLSGGCLACPVPEGQPGGDCIKRCSGLYPVTGTGFVGQQQCPQTAGHAGPCGDVHAGVPSEKP
jgi:hypothetical protein